MRKTFLRNIYLFTKNPENQGVSSWVQTFTVIIGVIIALSQLQYISSQIMLDKNKYLLEHQETITEIEKEFVVVSGIIQGKASLNKENRETLDNIFESYNKNIGFLSSCGSLGACPEEFVDSYVCDISTSTYSLLNKASDTNKALFHHKLFYERMINNHCGLIKRLAFWLSEK